MKWSTRRRTRWCSALDSPRFETWGLSSATGRLLRVGVQTRSPAPSPRHPPLARRSRPHSFMASSSTASTRTKAGRKVFDGAWPQIDGRMMVMNIRWGQPNNLMYLYMGGDEAPVWWADYPNLARGLPANGMLHRCAQNNTCPEILETFASAELYSEKFTASLCGFTCIEDIPLPANVHRYYTPGGTHGGGAANFTWTSPATITTPAGQSLPTSPIPATHTNNALNLCFDPVDHAGYADAAERLSHACARRARAQHRGGRGISRFPPDRPPSYVSRGSGLGAVRLRFRTRRELRSAEWHTNYPATHHQQLCFPTMQRG